MNVKRYTPIRIEPPMFAADPNGAWVLHQDHESEICQLREQVAVLQSQVDNADINLQQVRMILINDVNRYRDRLDEVQRQLQSSTLNDKESARDDYHEQILAMDKDMAQLVRENSALMEIINDLVQRKQDDHGFYYQLKVYGGCGSELSKKIELALNPL